MSKPFPNLRLNIALIFGGCSPEYAISLQSAGAIAAHLDSDRYNLILLGISPRGQWYKFNGGLEQIAADTWCNTRDCTPALLSPNRGERSLLLLEGSRPARIQIDAALPALHGPNGEDGTVQGLLELADIPIVGCGALASALCMDKAQAHLLAEAAGIAAPRFAYLDSWEDLTAAQAKAEALGYPLFVKPVRGGSSFGISRVADSRQLGLAIREALRYDRRIILEEAIAGVEIGCAVMGNPEAGGELITGELDEIETAGGFFDFTEKYTLKTAAIHVPARVGPEQAARLRETAQRLYRALGCRVLARVDMFLTPEGQIYFNEINTMPGFTAHSRFPNMLLAAGWSYEQILDKAIELGVQQC